MEEFINLHQGGMSVQKYSFMFTMFSKYAPSLVTNPRNVMINFIMGVFDDLVEECCSAILNDNMDIS